MTLAVRLLDGSTAALDDGVLQAFAAGLRGKLLRAGDPGYEEARRVWNGMIDRRPALIARCADTRDVVSAVKLARDHGLLVSVKGGGHSIAGLAVCEGGLVIDMSLQRGVLVDPATRTARAQAGCTLGDLDSATEPHGLAAVLGFVSTTGIAGLTVGGGFGYLTRRHGWTCDTLVSMEVVTADGEVVRAAADENPALFWSLRGGSGNFGIVTSFEYRLFPVGPAIVGGMIAWRADEAAAVSRLYRELTATAPRTLACTLVQRQAPPAPWLPSALHGTPMVGILACHTGDPDEAERALAPLRRHGRPIGDIIARRPYRQMQSLLDATQPPGRRYYSKSAYFARLEPRLLELLTEHAHLAPSPHTAVLLLQLEGALNELPADHSPVGNRDAAFVLNLGAAWDSPADDAANIDWARRAWEAVHPFSTGGVYINFLTEDAGPDQVAAAYGRATLDRLANLKRRYDPRNLFRHTKGVL